MIKNIVKYLTISTLLVFGLHSLAKATEIGIKDLKLGLDSSQYFSQVYSDGSATAPAHFTVGGVPVSLTITFDDNKKLGHIYGLIHPDGFEQIKTAFASKYSLNCKTSKTKSLRGVQLNQEECFYVNEKGDTLHLKKHIAEGKGEMSLVSKALRNQIENNKKLALKKAVGDI